MKKTLIHCPLCDNVQITKSGSRITRKGRKQRLQCQNCGKTFYSGKFIVKKSDKEILY